jgi:hypothetical protein
MQKPMWGAILAAIVLSSAAGAQTPVTKTLTAPITQTVTIQAIDESDRLVTIRNAKGEESTVYAGPEVKRFSELKVGQQVQMRYYESVVFMLARADQKTAALKEANAVTPSKNAAPGGTIGRQLTATVDVVAVDPSVPSITIKTAAGRTITRKVEDAKHLKGIKAGDRIVITYTEAALLQVE